MIFLTNLKRFTISEESTENKLKQISNIVNGLPWNQLDTEEKEFMADVLAPAIQAVGFNPWTIF